MKSDYMMNAYDVAMELGVSKGHAYKVIRMPAYVYKSLYRNNRRRISSRQLETPCPDDNQEPAEISVKENQHSRYLGC